jgi:predicted MFS family arabinose efflux permease
LPWGATFAGLAGSLVGIGLARFAYTPLIPALIAAGWFSPAQAAYLGAANLGGYLVGALAARPLAARAAPRSALRAAMLLAVAAFLACATPISFAWFFLWRALAGLAGGVLMVLAAPTVLAIVPPGRRGLAGGAIFTGVGLGIAASGLLVPVLLRVGLSATWLGLGAASAGLTLAAWAFWPAAPRLGGGSRTRARISAAVRTTIIVYGLDAAGVVPHMIFLVDFVARGLARGMAAGAAAWVAFGLGAMVGPTLAGTLADRIGFRPALRLALLLQAVMVALLLVSTAPAAILVSAAVVGAMTPGIVPLTLGRIHTLLPPGTERARAAWGAATIAWAVGQAAAAQAFSFIFARSGSYPLLFAGGTAALLAALALDLARGERVQAGG